MKHLSEVTRIELIQHATHRLTTQNDEKNRSERDETPYGRKITVVICFSCKSLRTAPRRNESESTCDKDFKIFQISVNERLNDKYTKTLRFDFDF